MCASRRQYTLHACNNNSQRIFAICHSIILLFSAFRWIYLSQWEKRASKIVSLNAGRIINCATIRLFTASRVEKNNQGLSYIY